MRDEKECVLIFNRQNLHYLIGFGAAWDGQWNVWLAAMGRKTESHCWRLKMHACRACFLYSICGNNYIIHRMTGGYPFFLCSSALLFIIIYFICDGDVCYFLFCLSCSGGKSALEHEPSRDDDEDDGRNNGLCATCPNDEYFRSDSGFSDTAADRVSEQRIDMPMLRCLHGRHRGTLQDGNNHLEQT